MCVWPLVYSYPCQLNETSIPIFVLGLGRYGKHCLSLVLKCFWTLTRCRVQFNSNYNRHDVWFGRTQKHTCGELLLLVVGTEPSDIVVNVYIYIYIYLFIYLFICLFIYTQLYTKSRAREQSTGRSRTEDYILDSSPKDPHQTRGCWHRHIHRPLLQKLDFVVCKGLVSLGQNNA